MEQKNQNFTIKTLAEAQKIAAKFQEQKDRIWPEFMLHDLYADLYWRYLINEFADLQLYLVNEENEAVAVAQTMPLTWDGTMAGLPIGWGDGLARGAADYEAGRQPNTLSAIEISILPEYHGQGISYRMIKEVQNLARKNAYQAVIVAVRPAWKSRYPLTPLERYAHWQRPDGAPFDPWLRAHWRSGAEILKTADPSMVIEGSVADWEEWTGMSFPESDEYVVPGALVPIKIDRQLNIGRYIEPNVWVHHPITTNRLRDVDQKEKTGK